MSRPVRLVMIGAGKHAGSKLYPNFHKINEARVVANCDLDLARAKNVGEMFGITRHYQDYKAMLAEEKPDGVMMCIGDKAHAALACEILAAGFHVFTEKPHAPTLAASREMLAAAQQAGRICMAGYKKRYTPAYTCAKAFLAEEAFGSVCRLHVSRSMGGNDKREPGYLWQWGCHVIDLVDYFCGQPAEIAAYRTPGDDWRAVSCALRFASGTVGELSMASPGGNWEEVAIHGSKMHAVRVWDGLFTYKHFGNEIAGGAIPSFCASNDGDRLMGFTGELQAFADAIRTGRQPAANIVSCSRTIALYEAMLASLASGKAAEVPQITDVLPDVAPLAE